MARLFISQGQLDRWSTDGKVSLEDDVMTVPAMGRTFRLRSAVHFTSAVDGEDKHGLLGKVKTEEQLAELNAEHYGTSVIIGENGYECVEGFLGVPAEAGGGSGASGLLHLG